MSADPIDGQIMLLTAAKASVSPSRVPELIEAVQAHLGPDLETYLHSTECIFEDDRRLAFLLERGFWSELGADLGLTRHEWDAVRRAHTEQLRRIGRKTDRHEEFDAALEIRDPLFIGRPNDPEERTVPGAREQ